MLHLLLTNLVIIVYLAITYRIFSEWLFFSLNDQEMSQKQRYLSMIILVLITIFWPIVIPFAYLELLKFHRKHYKEIGLLRNYVR